MSKTNLFISIHPDDIPFSLGAYIQTVENPIIVSPFCGIPDDAKGRFKHMLLNKEHDEVCEMLNVKQENGHFFDDVYKDTRDLQWLPAWFGDLVNKYDGCDVYVPIGISHVDHVIVRDIFVKNFRIDYFYAELPYRVRYPYILENLKMLNLTNRKLITNPSNELKEQACRKYVSQTNEGVIKDIMVEEMIWK